MVKTDLIGQRFGKLVVISDSGRRKNKSILWRCQCDCGGEILAVGSSLTGGAITNCGCIPKKRTIYGAAEDLTGRQFGELTALYRVENDHNKNTRWMCRCNCGSLRVVAAAKLKSGATQSCGCKRQKSFTGKDLTGQRFGRLIAVNPVFKQHKGNSVIWRCRCDCGNEIETRAYSLMTGDTLSCGCLTKELGENIHTHLHHSNDTCLETLISCVATHKNNSSGFRGVRRTKCGTYQAYITFQKKRYTLGTYKSFESARQVRLDAEESLHSGFIDAYQKWQGRAEDDSEWAASNPFFYKVQRVNGVFQVMTNAPDYENTKGCCSYQEG